MSFLADKSFETSTKSPQEVLDSLLMKSAIAHAWEFQTLCLPNPSVGALLYSTQYGILGVGAHKKAGGAHAEVYAFANAARTLWKMQKKEDKIRALDSLFLLPLSEQSHALHEFLKAQARGLFAQCSLYVSLEPCNHFGKTPPCAQLIESLQVRRVVIAHLESKSAQGGAQRLQKCGIEVVSGVCEKEAWALLLPFLRFSQNGAFRLFKLAMRLNGDYKSGQISSQSARNFTHNQRSVCERIIVSGKTFLYDLPRLDCRFASVPFDKTHLPKIEILTRKSFNPLQNENIKERDVRVCEDIKELSLIKGFSIIEGGFPLLESLKNHIDMLLIQLAPNFLSNVLPQMADFTQSRILDSVSSHNDALARFSFAFTQQKGEDLSLWLTNS
ncbi:bifunctional diaminohydroxyphosphoribosylaminopyrimidine deaminase/5-amino-6-(5-phosphoribosylamino)uracil reductase RibD [Helicobacter himalayensis]|uniref:bifunctional diaminohydroxyphosphoribosylaminopyrimidine deaminase/5-amino-6-(5-phosphoribosylamino)uracil reductase RibD n=1 Tax=Helicobacter himalayensis TaxID=1591088 RepID=UPI0008345F0C|nr:bifunctional diaminohydroxyphosphoribosylaminopyrimidine deaminase/5-amino-6-(5-phosphoribosylamino)uracil reductase RibD [Helicobacter himalayensis]